ncbi:hypothetical protein ASA1KI_11750 [Opitutales bacterium ASA1]|uniref:tetratricopeptide repeat protein n=1 Tax=Congregicoccus parvus TaxID=3081749 RepID=UPI002B2F0544|nr:hypothetical protein ASA1KI_11750 [Opitutales bacterium ASA1]
MTPPEKPQPPAAVTDARAMGRATLLFGFFRYRRIDGRVRVRPVWSRFFVGFAVLCVAGWLALATAAWWFVTQRRGVPDVSFFDIALPYRWDEYQRKRGADYLARARAAQERGEYREAYQLYRVGLTKAPGDLDGRVRLAGLLVAFGRPDMAADTLDAGLPWAGTDVSYLGNLVQLLLARQEDERLLDLVDRLAPDAVAGSERARLLGIAAATAHFFRGDHPAMSAALRRSGLADTAEGRLLEIRAQWERGLTNSALLELRRLIEQAPLHEEAHALLVSFLSELGRPQEAVSAAVGRTVAFPESDAARVGLLSALQAAGATERVARETDRLLAGVATRPGAISGLAEFAIETGDVALADRIEALAATSAVSVQIGALVSVETRLAAGDYEAALARLEALLAAPPEWAAHQTGTLAGLHAVALFGVGRNDAGELRLSEFLAQPGLHAQNRVAIARRLRHAGAVAAARRVLTPAAVSRLDHAVLVAAIELDLDTGTHTRLLPDLERLLAMRRPPTAFLHRAVAAVESDRFLFSPARDAVLARLEELLAGRPAEAR